MKDVLFSGLSPNPRNNVDFTFEATLDPKIILFQQGIVPGGGDGAEEPPAVEQLNDENLGVFGNPDQQQ